MQHADRWWKAPVFWAPEMCLGRYFLAQIHFQFAPFASSREPCPVQRHCSACASSVVG
jgi:hypothetical protein